ncbi:hypothetical protein CVS30_11090 [Arthrobacter psychrolactophilus]|uniref:DUF1700 domain-containing protein n=1 Tax=Arthrobacter psychrolactophilus TaxID=92442 RepID=A0A2V5ISB9_9MICC|nr:hypothetical protein [Arthrobacter psychrolactophilus]PYI38272.1 hypothetical protein CVS30_11090 [Arthrobacter psychrolactophilus]
MNHDTDIPEVRHYLAALETRLAQLPPEQSEEIVFGVREHISDALSRDDRSLAEILAALGTPDDVASGLADTAPPPPLTSYPQPAAALRRQSSTLWVVATAILLPFGAFLAGVGWLFGVAGLWMGTRWRTWEKILGTLVLPFGVVGARYLAFLPLWGPLGTDAQTSNPLEGAVFPGLSLGGTVALACVPLAVASYLLIVGLRRTPARP